MQTLAGPQSSRWCAQRCWRSTGRQRTLCPAGGSAAEWIQSSIQTSSSSSSSSSSTRPPTGKACNGHVRARPRLQRLCAAASLPQLQPTRGEKPRLAVFVSGGGSNFKAIHKAILQGQIYAEVAVVVSDVPGCGGVQYAKDHNIPTLTYPIPKKGGQPGLSKEQLVQQLTQELKVDYVVLAGYLKLVPGELVRCFKRGMLNIHPGLLPSFGGKGYYGLRVHQAVVASGTRFTGPTVHFVDEEYDTGPILAQRVVPVYPTDTPEEVAVRVLVEEHKVYPLAVSALVDGRITWREDGIPIIWSAH